ncbi:DUF2252 family protein [Paraburkholderia lacunae]|uniref:DUF2252 family protein n=1 Tax=Paraburkholderia lacunae TaxID=2211104 RepID=UPI001AD7EDE1|nr:DUF2252 family protein [Paraburkholderia lacunae]
MEPPSLAASGSASDYRQISHDSYDYPNLRQQVPCSSTGGWKAPANWPDPVEQIMHSHECRLDWLIPIRVGRMVASPYGFLRGTADVMAEVLGLPWQRIGHDGGHCQLAEVRRHYGRCDDWLRQKFLELNRSSDGCGYGH